MSGDLSSVQYQMEVNEFIENLKQLPLEKNSNAIGNTIEKLNTQFQRITSNGLSKNKTFILAIIDNFHKIVPLFDWILSNNPKYKSKTNEFLATLANSFGDVCLFQIFSFIQDTSKFNVIFRNYINLLKEHYFNDHGLYDNLVCCIMPIAGFSSLFIRISKDQIPSDLLSYLLTFFNKNWKCQQRELITRNILGLIKAFAKRATLVSTVIHHQWAQACVQCLRNIDEKNGSRQSFAIDYYICLIIQKVARHTAGVQILNEIGCCDALLQAKEKMDQDRTDSEKSSLYFLHCMIYALLMEANEIKQISVLNDEHMCQVLNQLISYTVKTSKTENFSYECFHISEMLSVLSKLFINDDILLKCLNDSNQLFDAFSQLIIYFSTLNHNIDGGNYLTDNETLLLLVNLFWSISFHKCYHEKFQVNTSLMDTLTKLAATSSHEKTVCTPRDVCSIRKAAEGILWNLKSLSKQSKPAISVVSTDHQPLVMISYSHSDSKFCRELVENLSKSISVWVDYKQAHDKISHSDDLWEEIARAMEMATAIVLILSKEYYDSKSCRQELSYASDTLKKRLIPIYPPNQNYRANGWLGIRIAGQKYIHFGRKPFNDAIQEIYSTVTNEQKPIVATVKEPIPVKHTEEDNKLNILKNWTNKEIQQWFIDNNLPKDLIELYNSQFHTGISLIIYARHVKLFYRSEFTRISRKFSKMFNGKKLDTFDFVTFVDALYRLRMEYDPDSRVEDNYDKVREQDSFNRINAVQAGSIWL